MYSNLSTVQIRMYAKNQILILILNKHNKIKQKRFIQVALQAIQLNFRFSGWQKNELAFKNSFDCSCYRLYFLYIYIISHDTNTYNKWCLR